MSRDARQVLTELLVLQCQQGDAEAFTGLHTLWRGELRRLATLQLGDAQRVEDVCQETWLAIARGLSRLDDPACFPRWAFRILDRRCIDTLRRHGTEAAHAAPLAAEPIAPGTDERPDGDDTVHHLQRAIARLDPAASKLLHLYYDAGLPVAAIATVLGIPAGTVKSRLHQLRTTLKQQIEREPRP